MHSENSIRLNKYISESGICSRREADRHIEYGRVFINGIKAKIGQQVLPTDRVMINGNVIEPKAAEDLIFLAFNKPPGITSTTESGVKSNIIDYVNHSERIFPIGRLDKDSQGLIFLTNNGDMVNKILRAGNKHEKEYVVTVDKPITSSFIEDMGVGVPILGETTKKCQISQESTFIFKITLIQGLNRQIRRMCEYFGYGVKKLERVRIMNIGLKGLPLGEWRQLDDNELAIIYKLTAQSVSTPKKAAQAQPSNKNNRQKENTVPATRKLFKKSRAGDSGSNNKKPSGGAMGRRKKNPKR